MDKAMAERIEKDVQELTDFIRDFSKEQKDLWQKVPYLALQADGRSGYSGQYSRAYEQGYWAIKGSTSEGRYTVYVDLETGELVDAFDPRKPADNKNVIVLALALALKELKAAEIVKKLSDEAKKSHYKDYKIRNQIEWRRSLKNSLGLKPGAYKRKVNPEEVHRNNIVGGLLD